MTETFRKTMRVIWYLISPLILYAVLSDLAAMVWQVLRGNLLEQEILLVRTLSSGAASVILGWWYMQVRLSDSRVRSKRRAIHWADAGRIAGMGISACLFVNHLLILLKIPAGGYQSVNQILYRPALMLQVLGTGILIPFAEELVFRGLGYRRLRTELPYGEAVLISSVFFGLYHGNFIQGLYALLLGAVIAMIYEEYDNILAAWLFHAAANLTSVLLTASSLDAWLESRYGWRAALTAVSGLLSVCLFLRIIRKERT